jgi:hypothetical protein
MEPDLLTSAPLYLIMQYICFFRSVHLPVVLAFVSMLISAALIGQKKLTNPPQIQPPVAAGINNQIHNENIVSSGDIISCLTILLFVAVAPIMLARIGIIAFTPKVFACIYVIHFINTSFTAPCMFFVKKPNAKKYLYNLMK